MKTKTYKIAFCSIGVLGVVTSNQKKEVVYADGNRGKAYIGYCIHDTIIEGIKGDEGKLFSLKKGSLWSSKNPKVITEVEVEHDLEDTSSPKFFADIVYAKLLEQNIVENK